MTHSLLRHSGERATLHRALHRSASQSDSRGLRHVAKKKSTKAKADDLATPDSAEAEAAEAKAEDMIEDAEIVENVAPSAEETPQDELYEDEHAGEPLVDAEEPPIELEEQEEAPEPAAETEPELEPTSEPAPEPVPEPVPVPEPEPEPSQSSSTPTPASSEGGGGAGMMILGGVIAAILGVAAVYFGLGPQSGGDTNALTQQLETQAEQIASLQSALEAAQVANNETAQTIEDLKFDPAPLQASIEGLTASDAETVAVLEGVQAELAATAAKVGELAVEPIPEAELPAEITEAYERQLAEAIASIDARLEGLAAENNETVAAMNEELRAQLTAIEAAQAEASATEEAALQRANAAGARAAIAQVSLALDNGTPFADQLAEIAQLVGVTAPDALNAVAGEGAPTLAGLQEAFPPLARDVIAALPRTSTAEDGTSSGGGLTSFFQSQLGARSLVPQEGNSPDAIMSRAEAAVRAGDLATAANEVDALPEAGKALLGDWLAEVNTLKEARAAADALAADLNSN